MAASSPGSRPTACGRACGRALPPVAGAAPKRLAEARTRSNSRKIGNDKSRVSTVSGDLPLRAVEQVDAGVPAAGVGRGWPRWACIYRRSTAGYPPTAQALRRRTGRAGRPGCRNRPAGSRVRGGAVNLGDRPPGGRRPVRGRPECGQCRAQPAQSWLLRQTSAVPGRTGDPAAVTPRKQVEYPTSPAAPGATVLFVEETGVRSDYHASITWAPVGATPTPTRRP